MIETSELLRWFTLFLLIGWRLYWHVTEIKAEREKPIQKEQLPVFHKRQISKYLILTAFGVTGVQLLGIPLFEMSPKSLSVQLFGFFIAAAGISISSIGRHNLGTNWARCYDYQVKEKQQLVTQGIYHYIRHPIYSGIVLFLIGAELVVQSYLVIPYCLLFVGASLQAGWEEKLLSKRFGEPYHNYLKRTKRFIPFVW